MLRLQDILQIISDHLNISTDNIIDLDKCKDKSEDEIMTMIGDLSLEKMDKTVLYCSSNKMSNLRKHLFSLAFHMSFDSRINTMIFFYKGDVFYDNIEYLSCAKIKDFLNRSSYEIDTVCPICSNSKLNLLSCKNCVGSFCNDCALKLKKKECPFCKTDISNFFKNIT